MAMVRIDSVVLEQCDMGNGTQMESWMANVEDEFVHEETFKRHSPFLYQISWGIC